MQARVASLEESLAGEQAAARDATAARTSLELSLRDQQAAVAEATSEYRRSPQSTRLPPPDRQRDCDNKDDIGPVPWSVQT